MKNYILFILFSIILVSCNNDKIEVASFSTTFGNALHGAITFNFDPSHNLLILKRVGSKKIPPTPPQGSDYNLKEKDSLKKEQEQYYLNYAKPKTAVYKLTKEESRKFITLINSIPNKNRKDSYFDFPTGDGFGYNYQIIFSNGNIEDVEVEHINISSHAKIIAEMLNYAKKYEKDQNNIQVLKNFENWNHPKY
nr:hypothetical protein [uncultured Chryseobacterium sp.]